MKIHHIVAISFLIVLFASCHASAEIAVEEAPYEAIFTIDDSKEPQGDPFSSTLLDDGRLLVVSNMQKVLSYSKTGKQLGQIGSAGRAKFEYLNPGVVKASSDSIYV